MNKTRFFFLILLAMSTLLSWSPLSIAASSVQERATSTSAIVSNVKSLKINETKGIEAKSWQRVESKSGGLKAFDWCDNYCCVMQNGVKYCKVGCTCA